MTATLYSADYHLRDGRLIEVIYAYAPDDYVGMRHLDLSHRRAGEVPRHRVRTTDTALILTTRLMLMLLGAEVVVDPAIAA